MSSRGILIVTKFGYRRGGAEAVAIDLARLLHSHGWRTAIFAMDFPANAPASPDIPLFTAPEVSIDGSAADKARAPDAYSAARVWERLSAALFASSAPT